MSTATTTTTTTTNGISMARALVVLRRRWYILLAATLIGGLGAFLASSMMTPIYHSTNSLYFSLRSGSSGSDINQGSTYTQNQMLSFARLASSAAVLDPVVEELDGARTRIQLQRMMDVSIPQNTVILEIRVGSSDRELAAEVANRIADSLIVVVDAVAPVDEAGASTVTARSIEPAAAARVQTSPNKQQNAVLGALAGLLLSSVAVVLASVLDTRVRSASALKGATSLPLLGSIEQMDQAPGVAPVVMRKPNGSAAESFREVRSGLRFASASHETRSLAITSSMPTEGKTSLAANLALVVAETGTRVLLIDADLRRPRIAAAFGLIGSVGLTTVLIDAIPLREAVQSSSSPSLDILASGAVPPNPAELLASPRMRELIAEVRGEYGLVVIDTAPVEAAADALVIAQAVDSTLVVADTTTVRRAQLGATIDALERAGAHISGIVLNRVRPRGRGAYSYYDDTSDDSDAPARPASRRPRTRVNAAADD